MILFICIVCICLCMTVLDIYTTYDFPVVDEFIFNTKLPEFYSSEDRAFATLKAINRKCSVYMFRENWQ